MPQIPAKVARLWRGLHRLRTWLLQQKQVSIYISLSILSMRVCSRLQTLTRFLDAEGKETEDVVNATPDLSQFVSLCEQMRARAALLLRFRSAVPAVEQVCYCYCYCYCYCHCCCWY